MMPRSKIWRCGLVSYIEKKVALPSSSGGFTGNNVDNPKNKSCKDVETGYEVATKKGEDEIVEKDVTEKEDSGIRLTKRKEE